MIHLKRQLEFVNVVLCAMAGTRAPDCLLFLGAYMNSTLYSVQIYTPRKRQQLHKIAFINVAGNIKVHYNRYGGDIGDKS